MNNLAPIVLFTYKRLAVTKRVLDSLLTNKECSSSRLIVYSDGPKNRNDEEAVEEVRSYLKTITGFEQIEYFYREQNLGLAQSFICGITETLAKYEKAIFLEDDNLLSEHFLSFMNQALEHYESNPRVICITGYSWPIWPKQKTPYFICGAETWTMATWRKGWRNFNADGMALLREIDQGKLRGRFSRDGFGFYKMLQQQVSGKIDSWGVRWWASAFVNDMYCLYPNETLCVSIGYGEESVHCQNYSFMFRLPADLAKKPISCFPDFVRQKTLVTFLLRLMNMKLVFSSISMRFTKLVRNLVKFLSGSR